MKRLQQSRHVLGSAGIITLVVADDVPADEIFAALWQQLATFEQRFSRFLPDSELTTFNQCAGERVPVSRPFRELLHTARDMRRRTKGVYTPFILPALQRAGYVGSWPQPAQASADITYSQRQGATHGAAIRIGKDWASIPRDTALDFGGIGKGYVLDELGAYLDQQPVAGYWMSLGGDILCSGSDLANRPWRIGVQDARNPENVVAWIQNAAGKKVAIATSGTTKRQGEHHGQHWHHIIDPRTSEPATTDILTATIRAEHATDADVYAKCLVIRGSRGAKVFLRGRPHVAAIIQTQDDSGDVTTQKIGKV